jgi:hypothetical protein
MALGALVALALPVQAATYKYTRDFANLQPYESDSWSSENRDYVQQNQTELETMQDVPVGYTDISNRVGVGEEMGGVNPYPDNAVLSPAQLLIEMQSATLVISDYSSLEEDSDVPPITVE